MSIKLFFKLGAVGLTACVCPLSTAEADEKPSAQVAPVKVPVSQATRDEIFAYLEKCTQVKSVLPSFPKPSNKTEEEMEEVDEDEFDAPDKLALWVEQRAVQASNSDDKARYTLLLEHLLIAQELLQNPNLIIRKQGLSIAYDSANFTAAHMRKEKWLLARIYEGFLLPQVSLAHIENWKSPSRQGILESAVNVFGAAGERPKQISVLEWLLSIGNKPKSNANALTISTNTMDWARGTLASLLFEFPKATQEDRMRALALLKSIQSPDMTGFKHLQSRIEASLKKQD